MCKLVRSTEPSVRTIREHSRKELREGRHAFLMGVRAEKPPRGGGWAEGTQASKAGGGGGPRRAHTSGTSRWT